MMVNFSSPYCIRSNMNLIRNFKRKNSIFCHRKKRSKLGRKSSFRVNLRVSIIISVWKQWVHGDDEVDVHFANDTDTQNLVNEAYKFYSLSFFRSSAVTWIYRSYSFFAVHLFVRSFVLCRVSFWLLIKTKFTGCKQDFLARTLTHAHTSNSIW